jgi:hypothetical protein
MHFYCNNARRRNHASVYSARAFFDLYTTGLHAAMATDIRPGDECIVATPAEPPDIEFRWYTFSHEQTMSIPDEPGRQGRVFFGTPIRSETLSRTDAIARAPYSVFFNVDGHFKRRSVIRPQEKSNGPRRRGIAGDAGARSKKSEAEEARDRKEPSRLTRVSAGSQGGSTGMTSKDRLRAILVEGRRISSQEYVAHCRLNHAKTFYFFCERLAHEPQTAAVSSTVLNDYVIAQLRDRKVVVANQFNPQGWFGKAWTEWSDPAKNEANFKGEYRDVLLRTGNDPYDYQIRPDSLADVREIFAEFKKST